MSGAIPSPDGRPQLTQDFSSLPQLLSPDSNTAECYQRATACNDAEGVQQVVTRGMALLPDAGCGTLSSQVAVVCLDARGLFTVASLPI